MGWMMQTSSSLNKWPRQKNITLRSTSITAAAPVDRFKEFHLILSQQPCSHRHKKMRCRAGNNVIQVKSARTALARYSRLF